MTRLADKLDQYSRPEKSRYLCRQKPELGNIWDEYPVGIREFLESEEYLDVNNECWPVNKEDIIELFTGDYSEAVFDECIGAGKSYKSSLILAYLTYKLLCLKDPQAYFKLARDSKIAIVNMSRNAKQAKEVVFSELQARIDNSPWFQKYGQPDPNVKSEMRFNKGIIVFPGNSKSTTALGYNVFAAIMDEVAWYTDTEQKDAADDMYFVLQRRINSRGLFMRKKEFHGMLVMISNPRYTGDFIERKFRESRLDDKMFGRKRAIWEVKPAEYWSGETFELDGENIPIELKTDFEKDPIKAWRDHGARPSQVMEPYFMEFDRVLACVNDDLKNASSGEYKIREDFRGIGSLKYHIHIDLAVRRDSAGVAMAHKEKHDGKEFVIVDMIMKIKPSKFREVQISDVRRVVYDLKNHGCSIRTVSYDGWQSEESRQELSKKGFNTQLLSLDRSMEVYDTFKDLINDEAVEFPRVLDFLEEMKCLELVKGKKVDHTPFSTKDVSDAVAGAVFHASKDVIWSEKSYGVVKRQNVINHESRTIFGNSYSIADQAPAPRPGSLDEAVQQAKEKI